MTDFDVTLNLTSSEKAAFIELKKRIICQFEKFGKDDLSLCRFLRARRYDVQKAEDMIIEHMKFREKYEIDTITQDYNPLEILANYTTYNFLGFDKEGSPVIYIDGGNADIKGILKSTNFEDRVKFFAWYMETIINQMHQHSKELGKPIESWVYILDFENYSIGKATYKAGIDDSKQFSAIYEANYPERLKTAIIINTPSYFCYVFNLFKVILPPQMVQKLKVFGKVGWKEELIKQMDPAILPASLGGTKYDPDGNPKCPKQITYGKLVPESYYIKAPQRRLSEKPGVKLYDLKRRSTVQVIHEVRHMGSYLEWEFESENHNIAFGLLFKPKNDKNGKAMQLLPIQKTDSHTQTEVGTFYCKELGFYILVLDNSYSWFRSKHIYLKSSVIEPKEDNIKDSNKDT